MERLCARAGDVAETTDTTADAHDDARDRALGSVPVVLQAIENAYMDHKGDLQ